MAARQARAGATGLGRRGRRGPGAGRPGRPGPDRWAAGGPRLVRRPVGARRLSDAEYWLGQIGLASSAAIAGRQAGLVGGLQHPLVIRDDAAVAAALRALAPTSRELAGALGR